LQKLFDFDPAAGAADRAARRADRHSVAPFHERRKQSFQFLAALPEQGVRFKLRKAERPSNFAAVSSKKMEAFHGLPFQKGEPPQGAAHGAVHALTFGRLEIKRRFRRVAYVLNSNFPDVFFHAK
jgi:hypothetical protein